MTAVIDAGNTRIKLYRNNTLIWFSDYTHWKNILHEIAPSELCIIVSVKPALDIAGFLAEHSVQVYEITRHTRLNFESAYTPGSAGMDRICGIAGIISQYGASDFALVDFGTATVINIVKNTVFCGGFIAPGIVTAFESITSRAENLKNISLEGIQSAPVPSDTPDALRTGTKMLYAYGVEGIIKKNTGNSDDFSVFCTGGNYCFVKPYLSEHYIYDDTLIPKGAQALYDFTGK